MSGFSGGFRFVPIAYAVLALLLWPIPVFGLLHAESSAVVAFAAYFVAGLSSLNLFREKRAIGSVLLRQEAALLVPWVLLTASLLWRPNCAYLDGLLFFLVFPAVTVVFAVALAYVIDALQIEKKKSVMVAIGLLVSVAGPLYDIGFHPQFYTYNHVFGGVLGPIYDEELAVRPGLFVYRGLTLAWAVLFVLLGRLANARTKTRRATARRWNFAGTGLVMVSIALVYALSAPLGLNTTVGYLRDRLDGHVATEHFDIYYPSDRLSESELAVVAHEHEYRYRDLATKLDVEVDGRIQSFLYPDPETKAALTGAQFTNVAPVWLATPQLHVLVSDLDRAFAHELAHVFSREFGLPIVRASLSVGIVEGLAVALEPPRGLPSPHEQVSAALFGVTVDNLELAVASRLSPLGFWTGRGAVSYTTMGSFVSYLLEAYGPGPLKAAYARAGFRDAYGKSVEALTKEWTDVLRSLTYVEASAGPLVSARFAIPSLFEKRCPHHTPPYRRAYRDAFTALARKDSAQAFSRVQRSLEIEPGYVPSLDLWSHLALAQRREVDVLDRLRHVPADSMTSALYVRLGDALAMEGDSLSARRAYTAALRRLPSFAHEDRSRLGLRVVGAGRPSMIRMLATGTPTSGDEPEPAVTWARALAHARQDRFELAVHLLRTTLRAPGSRSEEVVASGHEAVHVEALRRRGLVWLARFTYRSGAPSTAAALAAEARDRYLRDGAFNEAAAIDDFRGKMLWLASRESAVDGRSSNP